MQLGARERERDLNKGEHDYLKTPANENGTTTSPWRAKIQRIGLLNMIYTVMVKALLTNSANQKYKCRDWNQTNPFFQIHNIEKQQMKILGGIQLFMFLTNYNAEF